MKNMYRNFDELDLGKIFETRFPQGKSKIEVVSPGRINLIGEHTDYSGGFVLPAAVDRYIKLIISKNDSKDSHIYSANFDESFTYTPAEQKSEDTFHWAKLFVGAIELTGIKDGLNIVFAGNIPVGAGMSSSAAISTGVIFGINHLFGLKMDRMDIARMAQKVEHDYAGVNCGLMDQLACLYGKSNQAMLIDCSSFDIRYTRLHIQGYHFVLIDSKVEHQLNESGYNDRHEEFIAAREELKKHFGEKANFRSVSLLELSSVRDNMPDVLFRRARHIISENRRTELFHEYIRNKVEDAGKLLTASHESIRDDFEITVPQTDFIVEELLKNDLVLGARQMGGGFGGCVIALIKNEGVDQVLNLVLSSYEERFGLKAEVIEVEIGEGTRMVQ